MPLTSPRVGECKWEAAASGIEGDAALFEKSTGGTELFKEGRINNGLCEEFLNVTRKKIFKTFWKFSYRCFVFVALTLSTEMNLTADPSC